jgi:cephalosporin-C deacetylase-like acetyl esterase
MRGLSLVLLLAFAGPGLAQTDLTVWKPDADAIPPRKMLSAYLLAEAQKHFDARRTAIAGLQTPADVQRRQADLKGKFLAALGGFPERTPLNARVVGTSRQDGYRVERIVYESRPNHHVTANLYLPEGKGPFPGVLVPCGHTADGKIGYQRVCILLAKNGLAALCYDPIGQGERRQLLTSQGKPAIPASTSEHILVGIGALLVGQNTATYRIWDGMRSLDYLASRPEVDPKRLGCTGNSGGGTLTAYLMALDDRIVAAAPSCYITSLERLFATIGPQDSEQNITGQVAFGMEHADYLTLRAPRPTLICAATRDFFDIQGTWTTFREAKRIYGVMGHGERVDLFEYNTTHGFSKPQREAMLRWMRRWLMEKDDAPVEGDFPALKNSELLCTRTGQVLEDFKGKSAFDLNVERERELASQRAGLREKHGRAGILKEVRRVIAVTAPVKPAVVEKVGELKRDGYDVAKLLYRTEQGITVAGLLFSPRGAAGPRPLVLYIHGQGKATDAGPGGPIEQLVKAGKRVLALDPRGLGETAPSPPSNRPGMFGSDFKESYLALHLNRPLLGQRVGDVLAVIEALVAAQDESRDALSIIGIDSAGPIALHVAALDPRIREVTLQRSLISWESVVRTPIGANQLTNVVPGVLQVYDLPELAGLVAPRPLTVAAAVDAAGKPVSAAALDAAYAPCKTAYSGEKAAKQLTLQAAP